MESLYHNVFLEPMGQSFQVVDGTPLIDVLHEYGVEFPCGGKGTCGACKIRVLKGSVPMEEEHRRALQDLGLSEEWRLACQSYVYEDLTLEAEQLKTIILADTATFEYTPREGYGIAIDLGTTTLVAQLIDMQEGTVLNAATATNPQSRYGADIMSRVEYAVNENRHVLTRVIRERIYQLIWELLNNPTEDFNKVVLVGNTVMHHLFCGLDLSPLATYPFEFPERALQRMDPGSLGWTLPGNPEIIFMPPIGGFIGSDILAGILAARIHEKEQMSCLMDLGTNGEIVVGNKHGIICASTAAGPAFEGTNISIGMRATTGALSSVNIHTSPPLYHIIGNMRPRGICGSGLIDAIAWLQVSGQIDMWGQLAGEKEKIEIVPGVTLTQQDIREVQLAKGAISAGVQIICEKAHVAPHDLQEIFLSGAFGTYLNLDNANHIGLISFHEDKIIRLGNSALIGAKMLLFYHPENLSPLLDHITHISLETDPAFQEIYAMNMLFGEGF